MLDLGSGSGTDSFLAALAAGEAGRAIGIDMTDEQLTKATDLATDSGIANVEFRENDRYRFISDRADDATQKYGVTSISLLARRR